MPLSSYSRSAESLKHAQRSLPPYRDKRQKVQKDGGNLALTCLPLSGRRVELKPRHHICAAHQRHRRGSRAFCKHPGHRKQSDRDRNTVSDPTHMSIHYNHCDKWVYTTITVSDPTHMSKHYNHCDKWVYTTITVSDPTHMSIHYDHCDKWVYDTITVTNK